MSNGGPIVRKRQLSDLAVTEPHSIKRRTAYPAEEVQDSSLLVLREDVRSLVYAHIFSEVFAPLYHPFDPLTDPSRAWRPAQPPTNES